jgi:integrase
VKLIQNVVQALFAAAIDDGVIAANPADRLGRQLKLGRSVAARQEAVKAMTRAQLASFLATAEAVVPRLAPLFLLLARTGLRLGEALALQWRDIDYAERGIQVARAFSGGRLDTPKSGTGRAVDLSQQLCERLRRVEQARKAETLRRGWPELPPWGFCTRTGSPFHPRVIQRAFERARKAGGLPAHFTPHSLRHTFASLLLSDGISPAYVQRMLGHSSIRLTVDLYGRWLPMINKAAVDALDDGGAGGRGSKSGSKTVAAAGNAAETTGFLRAGADQPPKSFLSDSRKPPTRGPCSPEDASRSNSSSSSRWRAVSLVGTSTTIW